jgi:hypothetical protein
VAPSATSPSGPLGSFRAAGSIVETTSGTPVSGATLNVDGFDGIVRATTTTDGEGRFLFENLSRVVRVTVAAPGYLTRVTPLKLERSREDVVIDVIRNATPFSLTFYRQLARDGFDQGDDSLRPTHRWATNPRFYIRTVTEDTGELVPPIVLDGIRRVVFNSVQELSNGRLRVEEFVQGEASRERAAGWVVISFWHRLPSGYNGQATVGAPPTGGFIWVRYDPAQDAPGQPHFANCESRTVWIAEHEIVHTMGLYHTDDTFHDFHSGQGCPGVGRPSRTGFHADIVYQRPNNNRDIDHDPNTYSVAAAALPTESHSVQCAMDTRGGLVEATSQWR